RDLAGQLRLTDEQSRLLPTGFRSSPEEDAKLLAALTPDQRATMDRLFGAPLAGGFPPRAAGRSVFDAILGPTVAYLRTPAIQADLKMSDDQKTKAAALPAFGANADAIRG